MRKKQNLYTRKTKNFDLVNFLLDYFEIDRKNILQLNKNDVNLFLEIFPRGKSPIKNIKEDSNRG